jgi:hypothetical protein
MTLLSTSAIAKPPKWWNHKTAKAQEFVALGLAADPKTGLVNIAEKGRHETDRGFHDRDSAGILQASLLGSASDVAWTLAVPLRLPEGEVEP